MSRGLRGIGLTVCLTLGALAFGALTACRSGSGSNHGSGGAGADTGAGTGGQGASAGAGGESGGNASGGAGGERPTTTGSGGAGGAQIAGDGGTGGGGAGGAVDPGDAGVASDAGPLIEAFAEQARAIANDYVAWGRVDDELRWAPFLCRQPLPGVARPSESNDSATHGQKLYSVFAKNHAAYPDGPHDGQVVVKQSWTAELVTTPDASFTPGADAGSSSDLDDHFYPYAKGDGGVYHAADPAGLFIMFKVDPPTADTDEGWVYATVSPAGEVTSAGRVESCMTCHEVATHERLFGVPVAVGL